jgi:hypothetical protein
MSFIITSDNEKLTMSESQYNLLLFAEIFEGISWAVLIIFVVSMFVHKMAGL